MKKEQTNALLNGMAQVVELLNLYKDAGGEASQRIVNTKSSRSVEKNTQYLVFSEAAYVSIMTTLRLLSPFLVSLGVNLGLREEDGKYVLVYKGNAYEIREEAYDEVLANILGEAIDNV